LEIFKLKNVFAFRLLAIVLGLLLAPLPAWSQAAPSDFSEIADDIIDITRPAERKRNIAINDLLPLTAGGQVNRSAVDLPERLSKNLVMTGLFNSLDKRASLEPEALKRAGLDEGSQPDFPSWSKIGADYLIKGAMSASGSRLTLEMRLFDVGLGRQLIGRRYTGQVKDGRKMINQFTNAVLEAITGVPGVCGSEIIFASGPPATKVIKMTELGSDDAVQLAGHRSGPSTQPTMGPGGRRAWVHRKNKVWELLVDGRVISSGDAHMSPGFRPDGTVAAAVSGPQSTDIYAFSGRNRTRLTSAGGINVSPTFSPDGSRMAYASDQGGVVSIYVAPAGGGAGQRLVTGAKATDPAWSPTGEYIAFVVNETDICVIRPDGTGLRRLTGGRGGNHRPSFSPDGRMIVFSSTRNGKPQLFVMAANGDSQQPLMPDYGPPQEQPFWSPVMPPAH
jgi:TolB protein